jgi:hypothetical protein
MSLKDFWFSVSSFIMFRSFSDRVLKARSSTVFRWVPELPERPIIISETPRIAPCRTLSTLSKHSLINCGKILSMTSYGLNTEITDRA